MSEEKARWLAGRFDLVGLSCDGPPEIQNRQRPRWGGGSTARVVERTGHVLREEGCRYHLRTTITAATLSRLAEIVAFLCHQFKPEEIRLEPVYVGGRTGPVAGLVAHHADEFVTNFLEARQIARKHGVLLMTSGSRPGSIHGPYCHVFRHVVNLVPGGLATACFKITQAAQVKEKGAAMGGLNEDTGRFEIDPLRVQVLRQELDVTLPECAACFNLYHCTRECPDLCPLDDNSCLEYDVFKPGFRCQAQKVLTYSTLIEAAGRLWSEALPKKAERNGREPGGDSHRIICGTTSL
jgi:sulfatase maturation enzyme AslB (radical SAM superfamily)